MATTAMDYEDEIPRNYDDNRRSASPRNDDVVERRRSASPSNGDRATSKDRDRHDGAREDSDGAINPGSNLFVTGIHPRLVEAEVSRYFEKYGEVEKCQIMRDPHTKESRGFGFVKMMASDQANAAIEALHGIEVEGRTFSVEKARRARPRTPTPGKYFGPPKREGERGGGRFGGGGRFEDRRRGGGGGGYGGGREDPYRYRGYERRYEDREHRGGGGGGVSYRDDRYESRGERGDRNGGGGYREDRGYERRERDRDIDRYAGGGRDDRYGGGGPRGDDRRGGDRDRERYERGGDRGADRDAPRTREPHGDGAGSRGADRDAYVGGSDRNAR